MNHNIKFSRLLVFVIFCIGISFQGISQQNNEASKALDSLALKMFNDTNNRDFDALMDLTHPKLFDLVPKETMVDLFKSMFEGTDDFSVDLPKLIPDYKISSVFKDEENTSDYAFLTYDMSMSMTFNTQEFDEESKAMMKKMMKAQGMEAKFTSNKSLDLFMPNRMTIFINDESTENKWAMINYDPSSPMFIQILSASVLEKAKDYYQDLMIENKKKN